MLFTIISLIVLLVALVSYKKLGDKKFRTIVAVCLVVMFIGTVATVSYESYFDNNYMKVSGYTCTDEEDYPLCQFVNLYTNIDTEKYYIVKENVLGIKTFSEVEVLNDGEFYVVDDGDKIPMTQYGPAYKIVD